MEMTGERRIPAPRQRVWEALNDPEVLRASIPGCESVERQGEDGYQAKVAIKLGPMSARFGGKVKLSNLNPPASYTITGEGQGGAMGFAKGGADVSLEEAGPDETLLRYAVKAQVGGKMAQLGARLIDSTAKHMSDQFFDRFARQLTPDEVPTPAAAEDATDVPAAAQPAAAPAVEAPIPAPAAAGPATRDWNAARSGTDMAEAGAGVRNTDTEYLAEAGTGAGPLTQHAAEGPSAGGGKPVSRPNATPAARDALTPLRLLTSEPLGLPMQVWLGAGAMVVVLFLIFLT